MDKKKEIARSTVHGCDDKEAAEAERTCDSAVLGDVPEKPHLPVRFHKQSFSNNIRPFCGGGLFSTDRFFLASRSENEVQPYR